jgi:hypothetical protein
MNKLADPTRVPRIYFLDLSFCMQFRPNARTQEGDQTEFFARVSVSQSISVRSFRSLH